MGKVSPRVQVINATWYYFTKYEYPHTFKELTLSSSVLEASILETKFLTLLKISLTPNAKKGYVEL